MTENRELINDLLEQIAGLKVELDDRKDDHKFLSDMVDKQSSEIKKLREALESIYTLAAKKEWTPYRWDNVTEIAQSALKEAGKKDPVIDKESSAYGDN